MLHLSVYEKSPMRSFSAWKPQSIVPGESPPNRKLPQNGCNVRIGDNPTGWGPHGRFADLALICLEIAEALIERKISTEMLAWLPESGTEIPMQDPRAFSRSAPARWTKAVDFGRR